MQSVTNWDFMKQFAGNHTSIKIITIAQHHRQEFARVVQVCLMAAIKPPPVVCRYHPDRRALHHVFVRDGTFHRAVAVCDDCKRQEAKKPALKFYSQAEAREMARKLEALHESAFD